MMSMSLADLSFLCRSLAHVARCSLLYSGSWVLISVSPFDYLFHMIFGYLNFFKPAHLVNFQGRCW
jgi:hypothetical protein